MQVWDRLVHGLDRGTTVQNLIRSVDARIGGTVRLVYPANRSPADQEVCSAVRRAMEPLWRLEVLDQRDFDPCRTWTFLRRLCPLGRSG